MPSSPMHVSDPRSRPAEQATVLEALCDQTTTAARVGVQRKNRARVWRVPRYQFPETTLPSVERRAENAWPSREAPGNGPDARQPVQALAPVPPFPISRSPQTPSQSARVLGPTTKALWRSQSALARCVGCLAKGEDVHDVVVLASTRSVGSAVPDPIEIRRPGRTACTATSAVVSRSANHRCESRVSMPSASAVVFVDMSPASLAVGVPRCGA